ncbi:hypothetical protein KA478_04490 [Patescibacteria group bacterium]|nr:hypothetical protein [Patescibacteria group bacterium]
MPNKKELYFDGVQEFLKNNQDNLAKAVLKNFEMVLDNRYIQTYVVRTSDELTSFLQQEKLQTVFDENHIYLWDYNSSYNKIDTFIKKTVSLYDANNALVRESIYDVLDIA